MDTIERCQIWESNGPRDERRRVVVIDVDGDKVVVRNEATGKQSKLRADRLEAGWTCTGTMAPIPAAITAFTGQYGFAPTVRELALRCEIPTPTMHRRLQTLRITGLVSWKDGAPRTLTVVS